MTTIRLSDGIVKDDVLVVGLASKNSKSSKAGATSLQIESGDIALDTKTLMQALTDLGATGKADEVIKLPGTSTRLIVFTGLGKASASYDHEVLRRAAGAAARALAGNSSATFSLPAKSISGIRGVAEGAALGSYLFDQFRGSTKSVQKSPLKSITVHTCKAINDAVKKAGGTATGLKVSVMTDAQLKSKGYGGITGVGQGSVNPPRLLNISYTPKGAKAKKKYAFVGKGITFDSGGLALKPAKGMEAMKSDMSGAAAVCAATIAIALLKLPVAIETWAPLAENMISDTATRPSDVITIYGGKTVEVLNPDAEGRLVLADALVRAQETKDLDGIIDVATLTGAQVVALGTRTSAVMTNNEEFSSHFLDVTKETGEAFWPMPLPVELRASLDSPVADLANIGERMGGMLVAGLFLKDFVADELPWLHLDIAGPAYNEGQPHGYTPVGGTGIALRSLVQLAISASS